jgi:PAS domain S-box-containing protein
MKRRIIIGLSIFALIFFLGGLYIAYSITQATSTLDRLLVLHQVEILREHLLLEIKKVQADLNLKNTRYARSIDTVVNNVRTMKQISQQCVSCHHTEEVNNRLHDMERQIELYEQALSRVLTMRADIARLDKEEDNAYKIGEELVSKVNNMIALATANLEKTTQSSLVSIEHTRNILYVLVAVGPLLALVLAYVFISGFTRPIRVLVEGTRKLKGGSLEHRIVGLPDEFGELATSMNEMAGSLTGHIRKLQESEKRYRILFESAGDAIFIIDAEEGNRGRIVTANRAAAEMHGYAPEEIVGMNIGDVDTPEAARGVGDRIAKMFRGERIKEEITHRKKDGTVFPVEITAGMIELDGHNYILAFDRDITERKKAEEALGLSEAKFSKAFQASPDWITISTIDDGRYVEVNDTFERISGYRKEEVIGHTAMELGIWRDPMEREEMVKRLRKDGSVRNMEVHFRTRSGAVLTMLRSSEIIDYGGMRCTISVTRDITERRNAEIMLQRAERIKEVGEIAVGLAHEIKNPLAGIKSSMEVLYEEAMCSEEDRDVLSKVIREIRRIELLLKDLLNFARPPKPQFSIVDINKILDATFDLSVDKAMLSEQNIKVMREMDAGLPATMADPMQLKQVFLNLILNAVEAMRDGGTLRLSTRHEEETHSIMIEIADTGKGIGTDVMDKIFQPFFTTKQRGTGLGLSISKRLIEEQGGAITAQSMPDRGTTFMISLPVRQHQENVL